MNKRYSHPRYSLPSEGMGGAKARGIRERKPDSPRKVEGT